MEFERLYGSFSERDWETGVSGTVRFALCGLGWWTLEEALPAIRESDRATVTALVSRSKEKAERVAAEADVEYGLSEEEYHAGEAAAAYDAVYVATPNATHLAYVRTAADLEKAVLCEKPMEASVARAEEMVESCESAGVTLMVAYRMHTEPAVRRARELVGGGAIGEVVQVYGNNSQPLLSMIEDPDQWRLDPSASGYGTSMTDLGIYAINTTRFVLGVDPVAVGAQMGSYHDAFADVPDERSTATAVYEGGVHAAFTATQNAYENSELTITGTDGRLSLSPAFHMSCRLRLEREDLTVEAAAEDVNEMTEEFDYFADRVLSGEDVSASGEHGLVDVRILEALHRADETGAVVELD